MKILLVFPNVPLTGELPHNLTLLSAFLKREGFEVDLFDGSVITPNPNYRNSIDNKKELSHITPIVGDWNVEFNKLIDSFKPNIIGFSLVSAAIEVSFDLIRSMKNKNIPIITGGVGSTVEYEKILKSGLVDYVCIGEGEEAFTELCIKLSKGEDASDVKNIYTIQNGEIKKNPLRPLIDVNTLPVPDFSIYDDWRFYRSYNGWMVKTGVVDFDRGCPFSCSYCSASTLRQLMKDNNLGKYFRVRNNDVILNEMKILKEDFNLEYFYFNSETFLAMGIDKLLDFSHRYKEEINLPFTCQTRFDTITDENMKILADMGCHIVQVGLEHGSESIRTEILNKKITNEQILDGFKILSKYNLHTSINIMVGIPGETRETIFESIEIMREAAVILNHNYIIRPFVFMPFPGTRLRSVCIEKGYINEDDEISSIFGKIPVLNMPTISKEEVLAFRYLIQHYVGLPKERWGELEELEKNGLTDRKKMGELMAEIKTMKKKNRDKI